MLALSFHPGAVLSVLVFGGLIAWVLWNWSRRSVDAPPVLGLKLALSIGLLGAATWCILGFHPIIGVPLGAACGIVLGILWGKNIGNALARPLSDLYDGGQEEMKPKPFYAIAEAHRKQARYDLAIQVIEEQLDRFPGDPQGLLMLAEIRARNLGDWSGAAVAIDQVASQVELTVGARAKALQALADWHLDLRQDAAGAREIFQRIIDEFPGTAESNEAAQRIAHTGDGAWRREMRAPSVLHLPKADDRLGLRLGEAPPPPPEPDPAVEAQELCTHLSAHPLDTEARERLALIYADRLGRLDWAKGELEKLLAQPNHPAKSVARWLNVLADLHIRVAGDEAGARTALERVGALFPGTALEAKARSRLDHLKLELRLKEGSQILRAGSAGP